MDATDRIIDVTRKEIFPVCAFEIWIYFEKCLF